MDSARITSKEVQHIAFLARLGLSQDETRKFAEQFSNILSYFDLLKQVDTSDIAPTAQVIALKNVLAKDEVEPSMPREDFLRAAPAVEDGLIKVKIVLPDLSQGDFQ